MPTYTYECTKCGSKQDEFHGMSASPEVACSACGSTNVKRLLGIGAGLIFKGSGFYETDYKNKGKGNGTNGKSSDRNGDAKSESKGESKSNSKGEASKSASSSACSSGGGCGCAQSN